MSQAEIERLRREVGRGAGASVVVRLLMKLQRDGELDPVDMAAFAKGLEVWTVVHVPREDEAVGVVAVATFVDEGMAFRSALRDVDALSRRDPGVRADAREVMQLVEDAQFRFGQGHRSSSGLAARALEAWNAHWAPRQPRVYVRKGSIQ